MKRNRANLSTWPTFDAPLLQEVVSAFLRRRKALRYQSKLSCEREFSESASGSAERLNLDFRLTGGGDLRLSVWEDGDMWLRFCVRGSGRNSGWAFMDQFYGSIDDIAPDTLVPMTEETISVRFRVVTSEPVAYRERLRMIWRRVNPYNG